MQYHKILTLTTFSNLISIHLKPKVDVYVSRDLDSRSNARESAAVTEWRDQSNLAIHAMRDHPNHGIGLMGGSWGTDMTRNVSDSKGNVISARRAWKIAWKYMLKDNDIHAKRNAKGGPDQDILAK